MSVEPVIIFRGGGVGGVQNSLKCARAAAKKEVTLDSLTQVSRLDD